MARYRHSLSAIALMATCTLTSPSFGAGESPKLRQPQPAPDLSVITPLPRAQIDNSLEIGGEDVKAKKVSTRLQVEVAVNGRGPYRFVVDSGADTSAVGLKLAQDLSLPLGRPVLLNSTTSRNIVDRVLVDSLTVGPSVIRDLHIPALGESHLGGDGIIGIDALVKQRLMMDFEKKVVRVEDARKPVRHEPGEIVITARRERGQLILTEVHAAGLTLDAVIDTGSEITIGNSALRDKLVRKGSVDFWTVPATGVTGVTVNLQMTIIRKLQVGPIIMYDVPIAFADVPPFELFGLGREPALMLGTDLLEAFRKVSLDFRARKVRFQLYKCKPESVYLSTSPPTTSTMISPILTPDVCGPGDPT